MKITRRMFLKTTFSASGVLAVPGISCLNKHGAGTSKTNIVLIYVDDMGYGDLSCYGGDIPTPNIDSIAEQGIRFTDFYVSYPACTPSRYSLLTGCYPGRSLHGLDAVIMPGGKRYLDPTERILPEFLKDKSYKTGIFGKWHLGCMEEENLPMHHGFDVFTGHLHGCVDYFDHCYGAMGDTWFVDGKLRKEQGYTTDLITNHALDFITIHAQNNSPFFAYIPYNTPHYGKTNPLKIPDNTLIMKQSKWAGKDVANSLQAPAQYIARFPHITDKYRRYYSAMVSNLDDNVGRILRKLKDLGQFENTIIWFISDNGGYSKTYFGHASNGKLKGQKGSLNEGGIRVPSIVCWKEKINGGRTSNQPLCNIDLLPTLAAILGFKESLKYLCTDGIDMSPHLFQGRKIERDIYWQKGENFAMRRNNWKMLNGRELYDLEIDLEERHNVASDNFHVMNELVASYNNFAGSLEPYRVKRNEK